MAYADRNTSGSRVVSIVIVSIIVALFAWGFVNGLTFKYIKKVTEKLNTFDVVEPPPPPPDKPPPPPPEQPQLQTPPVVSPPPIVRVTAPPPPVVSVAVPPPALVITPRAAAPAPVPVAAPPAPRVSQAAGLKGNPADYFDAESYPSDALAAEASGRVVATLTVGADGRVSDCVIVTSSGNASLDRTTCAISKRRIRFTPAKDENGNPIVTTYRLPVRWTLPQ
jgi:protein TonB